jgi:phosphatidylglycerophosphatase A
MIPNKLKRFFATFLITAGGAGFAPFAPGTAGTLVGVFIVLYAHTLELWIQWAIFLALFLAGWWASLIWSRLVQSKDSQKIVIDEVLGYWLSYLLLQPFFVIDSVPIWTLPNALFALFVLFRIFDVIKPPPIRSLDRWGKNLPIGPIQSLMVTVDDLLAGVYTTIFIAFALHFLRFN